MAEMPSRQIRRWLGATGSDSDDVSRVAPRRRKEKENGNPLILVVDDDLANLRLAQALLEAEGFDVRTATDAISTFEVLKDHDPALILMDIQLPGMDGWELTRRLKANIATTHIPVIALTAYGRHGDEERARATGFIEFGPKPVSTRELPKIVRKYLAPAP
jgi:two-component system cell cycle response regulator DivK